MRAPRATCPVEEHGSCYFYRQPQSAEDTYRAVRSLVVCCVEAVRYGGADPDILQRIANAGVSPAQCDHPVPSRTPRRTHVTFRLETPVANALSVARRIVAAFAPIASYDKVSRARRVRFKRTARFAYARGVWVVIARSDDGPDRWLGVLEGPGHV